MNFSLSFVGGGGRREGGFNSASGFGPRGSISARGFGPGGPNLGGSKSARTPGLFETPKDIDDFTN